MSGQITRRPLGIRNVTRRTRIRMYSFASGASDLVGEGWVIAYSAAPMVLIRRDDGTQFWWRADAPHEIVDDLPGDGDKPTKPLNDEPRPDVPSKPIPKPPPKPK